MLSFIETCRCWCSLNLRERNFEMSTGLLPAIFEKSRPTSGPAAFDMVTRRAAHARTQLRFSVMSFLLLLSKTENNSLSPYRMPSNDYQIRHVACTCVEVQMSNRMSRLLTETPNEWRHSPPLPQLSLYLMCRLCTSVFHLANSVKKFGSFNCIHLWIVFALKI